MNDEELRLAYRRASKGAAPGPHPEPEQLERIVNGKGSEAERLVLLEHVLRCPSCGPELDLIRAAGEGARAAERRAPAARWLALAAAAILVIGLGTLALRGRRTVASDDVLRGRAHAMSLIEPESELLHLPDGRTLSMSVSPHPLGGLIFVYEDVTDRLALERSYNTLIEVQRETLDNLFEAIAVFGSGDTAALFR